MKRKATAVAERASSSSSGSPDGWSPSSSASGSNTTSTTATQPADTKSEVAHTGTAAKPSASRRGHSKSRLGCLNCKRRRVKCNELRPTCSPCRRLGLLCDYATVAPPVAGPGALQNAPSSALCLEDLRFYYQFLNTAFPSLPLRADQVWKKCAAMSHQSECLAHAALGLGALHLTKHGNVDYAPQALAHRVSALKIVNEQFAKPPRDQDNADSLFAALICLAAQTTLLPDGIAEYMTITRAGALVWAFVIPAHGSSVFRSFTNESHSENLSKIVSEEPKDFDLADEFLGSVTKVKELCTSARELYYCQRVVDAVEGLRVSSLQAWLAHAALWRAHCYFSNEDFQAFIAADNHPARLLIAHMLLVDYLLGQFCVKDSEQFTFTARKEVIVSWVRNAICELPKDVRPYGDWLMGYCDVVENSDGRYLLTP